MKNYNIKITFRSKPPSLDIYRGEIIYPQPSPISNFYVSKEVHGKWRVLIDGEDVTTKSIGVDIINRIESGNYS